MEQCFCLRLDAGKRRCHRCPGRGLTHPSLSWFAHQTPSPLRELGKKFACAPLPITEVDALDGAPFFCVTKPIDPGLQQTLETDIVPRLLLDVPGQPCAQELADDPWLHRLPSILIVKEIRPICF